MAPDANPPPDASQDSGGRGAARGLVPPNFLHRPRITPPADEIPRPLRTVANREAPHNPVLTLNNAADKSLKNHGGEVQRKRSMEDLECINHTKGGLLYPSLGARCALRVLRRRVTH